MNHNLALISALVVLLGAPTASAQSLGDILRESVRETLQEHASGQSTRGAGSTSEHSQKPDYMRDSWNNQRYVPLVRNGYNLLRVGTSDLGKYGGAVGGRDACDEQFLASALTGVRLSADDLDLCRRLEEQIQGRGREYDKAVRRDMPAPDQVAALKTSTYGKLPLKLYFHPSVTMMQLASVQRRPKGLYVDVGNTAGSTFLAGSMPGVSFTIKGREVVTSWTDYIFRNDPSPNSSHRGHVRFFLPATDAQMDKLFGVGSLSDQRVSGLDTLYYTVHKVRDIGRTITGERHFEVTVSIDRLEIGMDKTLVDPATYQPREMLVWTAGGPLKE